jgi:hypothetical protein
VHRLQPEFAQNKITTTESMMLSENRFAPPNQVEGRLFGIML